MLSTRSAARWAARRQRGLTLVEVLVGLVVGLFVVAGGLAMLATFTDENRRLLLEARLAQDLRAASDVITRDIRRAGYWQGAHAGVWRDGGPAVPPQNAYRGIIPGSCDEATPPAAVDTPTIAASALCYYIETGVSDNVASAGERYGFKLEDGILYAIIANSAAQPLTDPNTIVISDFVITPSAQSINAASFCNKTCTVNCPRLVVREFELLIKGNVPGNAGIFRVLRSNVRVRNDFYEGSCPT
jgi:prepilin peptidase dependent protein B